MKRIAVMKAESFGDESVTEVYARNHHRMVERLGEQYARKLAAAGFLNGRILDAGCGIGGVSLVLAKKFPLAEVVGIDLSEPLLRLANRAAQEAGIAERARFEIADVEGTPYAGQSFNVILNLNVLHLVQDPVRMLNEMERLLAPGGIFYAADLRRSPMALLEQEIRAGLTLAETKRVFARSRFRPGRFQWGLIWWRFETD